MIFSSQKFRKKVKKLMFRAPDYKAWRFVVSAITKVYKKIDTFLSNHRPNFYISRGVLAPFIFLIVVITALSITTTVESNLSFTRKLDRLLVLPGSVQTQGWENTQNALVQDVQEDAVYQAFTKDNSAFFKGNTHPEHSSSGAPFQTTTPTVNNSDTESTSTPESSETETTESNIGTPSPAPASDSPMPPEAEPSTSPTPEQASPAGEPSAEVVPAAPSAPSSDTSLQALSKGFFTLVARATQLLPFAQESVTEPVTPSTPETPSVGESTPPETSAAPEAPTPSDTLPQNNTPQESVQNSDETQSVEVQENSPVSSATGTTPAPSDTTSENSAVAIPEAGNATEDEQDAMVGEGASDQTDSESDNLGNWIEFDDFGLPPLNSGQFIRNVQLRISLGGTVQGTPSQFPALNVEYSTSDGQWVGAGSVLLDGEVSNALNGGYYLFALPTFRNVSDLAHMKVRVSFSGDASMLNAVYVDSAWLEIDTETFTREMLNERIHPSTFSDFKLPDMYEYIGTAIDFTREEAPQFTLKYESQRNPVVGFFRNLFGRKLLDMEKVTFKLVSGEVVPVHPDVQVTDDGLLTIQLTDEDKAKLQPGKYSVELTADEGGKAYTDSFNFQWGVLTLNTDQTTYQENATTTITLGALSENGNTLCDAHLQLYIFDPNDYISDAPVTKSGLCNGNNQTDVPDYTAEFHPTVPGTYEMYVEHIGDNGEVLAHAYDTFIVRDKAPLTITRAGPTRINPRFTYPMTLTVTAQDAFTGELVERVPQDFTISDTSARIVTAPDGTQELHWDLSLSAGEKASFTYTFDAPDISPWIYNLGPASITDATDAVVVYETVDTKEVLTQETITEDVSDTTTVDNTSTAPEIAPGTTPEAEAPVTEEVGSSSEEVPLSEISGDATPTSETNSDADTETPVAGEGTSTSTTTTSVATSTATSTKGFKEHRRWQIASDATGSALLYWDSATIPSGWTCVSCAPSGVFYQRLVLASSTAGTNGGATTHTHTMDATVPASGAGGVSNTGGGGADSAQRLHTHTLTPTVGTASNLPPYRNLVLIQSNSAGAPASIPAGAIALFDASVPAGWTQYAAENGVFPRAESTSTIGTTGGAATHTHAITGTTSGPNSTTNAPGFFGVQVASNAHTHTVNGSSSAGSSMPPYIGAILGKLNATSSPTDGMILMWTDEPPSGWNSVSSTSEPFENRFVIASTTYGTTGGSETHSHADFSIVSSGPSASGNRSTNAANADASNAHTHTVNFTNVSTENQMPPYRTAIFAKRSPGGAPPLAPTIYSPFDNERTATSTFIFDFSADDPDGSDTLVYEVQWDDDNDFTADLLGDRTSDNETGCSPDCFKNSISGGDTNPFNDNERIRFTATSSMTSGVTYYYRVRAKETIGGTWSPWATRSVTYDSNVTLSEWYQTQGAQFDTDTLTNVVTATDTASLGTATTTSVPQIATSTRATSPASSTITLTKPSGVQAGDLLLIVVGNDDNSNVAQWDDVVLKPSGFNLINESGNSTSDAHVAAFYRIADGTESGTIDVSAQNVMDYWGFYIRVTGASTTNPINVIGTDYNGGSLVTHNVTGITTTVDNTLAFYALSGDGGDTYPYTVGGSWTEGDEVQTGTAAADAAGTWGTRSMTTAGATGNAAVSMNVNDSASAFQFAINPAVGRGSIMSQEIPFTSVPGRSAWGEVEWHTDTPNDSQALFRLYYSNGTACDTLIPDSALPGNNDGFTSDKSPMNIDGISTTTYNKICLNVAFTKNTSVQLPSLEDWTVRWIKTPKFVQQDYRWYANTNAITPTDPWPVGGDDLGENVAIDTDDLIRPGDVLRLRMSLMASTTNAVLGSSSFKLQYAATTSCAAVDDSGWSDVGSTSSTTAPWRGYNNAGVADAATLPSKLLTLSDYAETYEEQNNTYPNPAALTDGDVGEWDWVVQQNGAAAGTAYCFRMAQVSGAGLKGYLNYPTLVTNFAPNAPILSVPFANEKIASTSPYFDFVTDDAEGEDIDYQIQIDNDANFGSTLIDTNSISNLTDFKNLDTPADKSPFSSAQNIRYTIPSSLANGTTYWWRVRAIDSAGSGSYGEWSLPQSFTIDTSVTISTWFQTTEAQFDTDTLEGTDATGGNLVQFATGSTTGTTTSSEITFTNGRTGNAWGQFSFSDTGGAGAILYHLEYFDGSTWTLIPDSALSGNAAGFDTSPVSLLNLDSSIYDRIRIRANFNSGSPTLLDWTIQWGQRVSVPTLLSPFSNEKFTDTTPLFTFVTTDPQGDDLQYEVSWSTSPNFTSSTTRDSSLFLGFSNTVSGGDTNPFNSGEAIAFQMQPVDTLTASTTYWWRVRAKDPGGSNSYSFWSAPWSFTTATSGESVPVSTWFQTTGDQFLTGSLSNATATAGSVSITGGIVVQSFTSNTAVPGSTLSLTKPSGVQPGDLLLIFVGNDNATNNDQWSNTLRPSGFTSINESGNSTSDAHVAGFYKIADGTEANSTTTPAQSSNDYWGYYIRVTGVSTSSPIDVISADYNAGSALTHNVPGITTTVDKAMAFYLVSGDGGDMYPYSVASPWTEGGDIRAGAGAGNSSGAWGTQLKATAGATGNAVVTSAVSDSMAGFTFSLTPATVTTGTLVSPSIDFDDGDGPAWGALSWRDSEPGASEARYHLEYLNNVGVWESIPDTDLSGNSSGFTTSPVDLHLLNTTTYNQIRAIAAFNCDGANCPTLNDWTITWSAGFTISGSAFEYNGTASTTSGTVAVAINGVLQAGKTGTISNGAWTIPNVTFYNGDVVTVFVQGATDADEAAAVTVYDGTPDMSGLMLKKRHLTLGSDDYPTITNAQIGQYDFSHTEDLFFNVDAGNDLNLCATTGCSDAGMDILPRTTYALESGANLTTYGFKNDGTFIPGANTVRVAGSWDNNASTTMANSSVIFTATSSPQTLDDADGVLDFQNVTFGEGSGTATWNLNDTLAVSGALSVTYGTLARQSEAITVAGNLTTGANGFWTGVGTTTFNGINPSTWSDQNATKQDIGRAVVDGTGKTAILGSNVRMQSLLIGADDTFDLSNSGYTASVSGSWTNGNVFLPRTGTVAFIGTSTAVIANNTSNFYNLTFNGVGGAWSFTTPGITVQNDLTIATGTVTLPTATTTVGGSFLNTGGTFAHNNALVQFTTSGSKTITLSGTPFTNAFYNVLFSGSGSWAFSEANATTTNAFTITGGSVTLPSGTLAVGGAFAQTGGAFAHNNGTVRFTGSAPATIDINGSNFNALSFTGTGARSFLDASVTALGNVQIQAGTVTLPTGTFRIGGSLVNTATMIPGSGTVLFNSTDTGEIINLGNSSLYNVTMDSPSGGWTITAPATTTNNFTLTNAGTFTLQSGQTLSVGGVFTNSVGGASTTWSGSTLALTGGAYSINTKTNAGDAYDTLRVGPNTDIKMWNSVASTYAVDSTGSLYSQDHNGVDGALFIWGGYERTTGTEYWDYAKDFDGTALGGGSERAVTVSVANGSSIALQNSTLEIVGTSSASTTIQNQGSGSYSLSVASGTLNANRFKIRNTDANGLTLTGSTTITSLSYGDFELATNGGSLITVSSTTVNQNPALQILGTRFATSTGITGGYNVTQSGGAPTSYWWFRGLFGNYAGEAYDNDTGNPGSIRWDDSNVQITVAGVVYADDGVTPMGAPVCDGVTQNVRVVVNGGSTFSGSCNTSTGVYSIPNVSFIGDPVLTVYLNTNGGARGVTITKTPTVDITDLDIHANQIMTRHQDASPLTILDMAVFDVDNDTDIPFTAATGTLTILPGTELHIASSTTFAPGGDVTIQGNASSSLNDGSLHIGGGATFLGSGTSTYTFGGSIKVDAGAFFSAASSTVIMNATTTGKTITTATSSQEIIFNTLRFTGAGGGWNINANIQATNGISVENGVVSGTGNIRVLDGSFSGNGTVSMGSGTTTIEHSNTLGGTSPWTFGNLVLGNGLTVGTTTPASNATTTLLGRLTIANAHTLAAGGAHIDLRGSGNVFVENGVFQEATSTVRYSGTLGANVLATTYYDLEAMAVGGSPTYTATGLGIIVSHNLSVGNGATTTLNFDTNDTVLDVDGNVSIAPYGTLVGSNSALFTVGGSWGNDGTFTGSNGTVTFDGSGASTIAPGASSFSSLTINGSGSFAITEDATTTGTTSLTHAGSFTLQSGKTLAVGGTFINAEGGSVTTWTGSTLAFFGGGNYTINAATTTDTYDTLRIDANTQIRMWNSSASTYLVASTGSLYSQDHGNVAGALNIYGAYQKTSGNDYWSYATDFDGTTLGGSARQVTVSIANGSSVTYTGGSLAVVGTSSASTTIQNQGSGTYALTLSGTASSTWSRFALANMDANGLQFSGTAKVVGISLGRFDISQNGGSGMTVAGSVITQNPAKTFSNLNFATSSGVSSAYNVTASGTTTSSWRFTNHTGALAGEAFDNDPGGDPGYLVWDDSAAQITISGKVYSDEGSTVSSVCDGVTHNIHLRVAGLTSYTTSCASGTGAYSIPNVSFGPSDSLVVYIDGETEKAATVTADPISNIADMDLYEQRVIVRHENTNPLTIDDMTAWDATNDADIPFTATDGSPDTLVLPSNFKLIVWTNKKFQPGGNVTISGGGGGAAYDGTLEVYAGGFFDATGNESHTIGGSLIMGTGATIDDESSTITFTTSGAGRTVDTNDQDLYDAVFNGTGSWNVTNTTLTVENDLTITQGAVTLPSATTTIGGSLAVDGGSFAASGGTMRFTSASGETIKPNTSSFGTLIIDGTGSFTLTGGFATSTGSLLVKKGTFTSATGTFAIGKDFINSATFTHANGTLRFTNSTSTTVTASSSDLGSVTFAGSGPYIFTDQNLSLLGSLRIESGAVALPVGTLSVGGSFLNTGGSFTSATGTILFNSTDTGEVVNPGSSPFYNISFASAGGGWTIPADATSTGNFSLVSATNFTLASSTSLSVGGVFTNLVGGAATTWAGSTLHINSGTGYTINTKTAGGDAYNNLIVGSSTALRAWDSSGAVTVADGVSSFYSQDNAGVSGNLNIYGNYVRTTGTDYWSYATDFDGAALGGGSRKVTVRVASGATTTMDGGSLQIVGVSGNKTDITNQGSGTYALRMQGGTFNAYQYSLANMDAVGLALQGTTTVSSLSEGAYTLAVNGGALISVSSTTLNYNAGLLITNTSFATTTAITGYNIAVTGSTVNAWTLTGHSGNLDGESFDYDDGTQCGSIRWEDSLCLLTKESGYRFRSDDGGEGVPNSEWYSASWTKRKRVTIQNNDAVSYTNAVVPITVSYDSDMQADFDDLRFTLADGTTTISYFIEKYSASTQATVWLKIPTLATSTYTSVFMYYGNGTATDTSATSTFPFLDTFEDGNITEYSGDTGLFTAGTGFAYERSHGVDASGNETQKTTDGIYRTNVTVSQGQTLRYLQYIDTSAGSGDETCTLFGVQSPGSNNQNYAVCLEQFGVDRVSLAKNVSSNDTSGTILASSTITYTTGWYEVSIDWNTNDVIGVTVSQSGSVVATTSATDSSYTQGGVGFSFWFQNGGWDIFSARPQIATAPTINFGSEQVSGGASWRAALNTPASNFNINDNVRIRFLIENSGLAINDANYQIEYAAKGSAPSCEAVTLSSYAPVPIQSSCGTNPICMQASSHITNGEAATDLLGAGGAFVNGQVIEDNNNTTGNIDIATGAYTELEYVVTPTTHVADDAYCFRVSDSGTDLDAYTHVAELGLKFAPTVSALSLNGGNDITLSAGATTTIYATGTVSDLNGYADITTATTTIYRSGVGETCSPNNNNCYVAAPAQCSFNNCSGNTCNVSCSVDMYYHADPTDIGTYAGETWRAYISVADAGGEMATATAPSIDLLTLRALSVGQAINYGALAPNSDTGSYNATTTLQNIGNDSIDVSVEGTDLTDGGSSNIPVSEQRFATSTFTYSACVSCTTLSTSSINYKVDLGKPASTTPAVTEDLFWGIAIPFGVAGTPHHGTNIFYAIGDI